MTGVYTKRLLDGVSLRTLFTQQINGLERVIWDTGSIFINAVPSTEFMKNVIGGPSDSSRYVVEGNRVLLCYVLFCYPLKQINDVPSIFFKMYFSLHFMLDSL